MKVELIEVMKNCGPVSKQRNQCGSRHGATVGAIVVFIVGAIVGAIAGAIDISIVGAGVILSFL